MNWVLAFFLAVAFCKPESFHPGQWYSVHLDNNQWKVNPGRGGIADAQLVDNLATTGWYTLNVISDPKYPDAQQAYAAGYLEAALTAGSIWDAFRNLVNGTTSGMSPAFAQFIMTQDAWIRQQVADNNASTADTYWAQVGLVMAQFDGLYDGYSAFAWHSEAISYADFLYYQLQFEIGDIQNALGEQNTHSMNSHCSVLIKPTADDLYMAHDTWSGFSSMLRIYKHYTLPYNTPGTIADSVSFSSFPATLPSGDDFYITSANLVVLETTNEVMNMSLYAATTPETVPYWIRVLVANRVSDNGQTWVATFAQFNSGTYNNQWMVIDNKLVTPGSQVFQPNTLWVLEQVPSLCVSEDMSSTLNNGGYWASYNVPFFPEIYDISGYPSCEYTNPSMCSYSQCTRALIFARDQDTVTDLTSFKAIMRYNEWQYDPLSLQDACRGISARCDLNAPWVPNSMNGAVAFGGIDSKVTSASMSPTRYAEIVCGPTWDAQPPFAWTEQWSTVPHYGHPQVFAFDFVPAVPSK